MIAKLEPYATNLSLDPTAILRRHVWSGTAEMRDGRYWYMMNQGASNGSVYPWSDYSRAHGNFIDVGLILYARIRYEDDTITKPPTVLEAATLVDGAYLADGTIWLLAEMTRANASNAIVRLQQGPLTILETAVYTREDYERVQGLVTSGSLQLPFFDGATKVN